MNGSTDIIRSNISVLRRRANVSDEQMRISLKLLTDIVCVGLEVTAEDAYRHICAMIGEATAEQKAIICRNICSIKKLSDELLGRHLLGEGEYALPGTHGKIAYVHNVRSDKVFFEILQTQRNAKAYHVSSFTESCEAVYNNTCEFCLLPIKNNVDGNLYSFYSMIDKYELKICDTFISESDNGSDVTEFALVTRGIDDLKNSNTVKRFEFSVICENADIVGELMRVLPIFGGQMKTVGTQPVPYDDFKNKYYFSMDFDSVSPLSMVFFLSLEYSRFSPIGLYTVKAKEK